MTEAKMSFVRCYIFCSCFFKAFASSRGKSLTDSCTNKVFLPKYFHYLPFIYPLSWWSEHSSGTSEMQKTLFLTCCHLPSPTLQCVMLLVPSWYSCFTWEAVKSGFWVWDWRSRGTKESCDKMFSKERPGWFLVSSPGNIYLIPSKEIG